MRVVGYQHSIGIMMYRRLTGSQRAALIDAARGADWNAAYIDVLESVGGGRRFDEQTDDATPRGLGRILREANEHAA